MLYCSLFVLDRHHTNSVIAALISDRTRLLWCWWLQGYIFVPSLEVDTFKASSFYILIVPQQSAVFGSKQSSLIYIRKSIVQLWPSPKTAKALCVDTLRKREATGAHIILGQTIQDELRLPSNLPKQFAIKQALRSEMKTTARTQGISWGCRAPFARTKRKTD